MISVIAAGDEAGHLLGRQKIYRESMDPHERTRLIAALESLGGKNDIFVDNKRGLVKGRRLCRLTAINSVTDLGSFGSGTEFGHKFLVEEPGIPNQIRGRDHLAARQ